MPNCPADGCDSDTSNTKTDRTSDTKPMCVVCRDWVANGREVSSKEVSLAEAKAIKGLRAVFGEVRGLHGEGGGLTQCEDGAKSCGQPSRDAQGAARSSGIGWS